MRGQFAELTLPQHHDGACPHEAETLPCVFAVKDEASLGSRAWNLSLTPASLSPDMRLMSTADLMSINSLAPSLQPGRFP